MAKKLTVDRAILKDWMKEHSVDYRGLSELTGMSITQAYNLVRHGSGGPATLGYLVAVGVPLILVTRDRRGRITDAQPVEVRVL